MIGMKKSEQEISSFVIETVLKYGREVLLHTRYLDQKTFIQHAEISVYDHCLSVCCLAVHFAYRHHWKVDYEALVRGALLHDYFLYDWHKPHKGYGLHGYTHPYTACRNAERDFQITKKERNIIRCHMFPLTFIPPRYKESWIVNIADDVSTHRECHKKMVMKDEKEEILRLLSVG
jgi:uncharacterized protein